MLTLTRLLDWLLPGVVLVALIAAAGARSLAADPGEWRLLSRVRINPPEVRAFIETSFSHNQLKADPGGGLVLGFTAVAKQRNEKDTDVFVSRFVRSEDRWNPPVPIAESKDLERSPAIWIDDRTRAIHAAWVGHERRKSKASRRELRVGYRRSEDGGATWTPPLQFPVGTKLARRPQLMGDEHGHLYLAISNGYPGGKERIHLFQSTDGGGNWRPAAVNFPEDRKRGNSRSPQLAAGPGVGACLVWLDPTVGRRAAVFSRSTGRYGWSTPVRVNDDASTRCIAPRLAVRGDSIYVAWKVVRGDWTTLYFDHSQDGGATWNTDQVIFKRRTLSVRASLQPIGRGLVAGWVESKIYTADRRLSYRFYSPGNGWKTPEGERDAMAGDHGSGRFYYGFDLLPWKGGCLVAYSKGAIGLLPEIYLAWGEDLESGFSELMKISASKKGFEHLYPRLVRSGENEVAVVYNRRKIRRSPMEPRVTLGDVLVARIGIP